MSNARQPKYSTSAIKVFKTLDVLFRNFATGFTNKELVDATGYKPAHIVFHLNTLIEAGYAEQIPDTDRYRPSVRMAQRAMSVSSSLQSATSKFTELQHRINREL